MLLIFISDSCLLYFQILLESETLVSEFTVVVFCVIMHQTYSMSNMQYINNKKCNKETKKHASDIYYYTWLPTNKTRDIERGVCGYKLHCNKLI